MPFEGLNYLAILVCGIASMAIGALYYSPLVAGKAWMKEVNFDPETAASPMPAMIKSTVASLVLAVGIAVILQISGTTGAVDGARLGFTLGLLIVAAASFPNYAYENKTFKHFLIHIGYTIITMTVMGAILGAW